MTSFNVVKRGLFFKDKENRLRQCLKDAVEDKEYLCGNKEGVQYPLCFKEECKAGKKTKEKDNTHCNLRRKRM
jgi:hypothetical protein